MNEPITRRAFLALAGAAAAVGGFAAGRVTRGGNSPSGDSPSGGDDRATTSRPAADRRGALERDAVKRLFLGTDGPGRAGAVYLASHPEPPAGGESSLPEGFVPVEPEEAEAWLSSANHQDLSGRASFLATADYSEGRAVEVGGWRLARSTAELCALIARSA
ncbi:MAG: hypothetical protein M5T61_11850 [Acidimicrobiia bacterium]|nr:hypothetical protein [Acidimicrobiia bacterium]